MLKIGSKGRTAGSMTGNYLESRDKLELKNLKSSIGKSSANCKLLHKSVEFSVDPNTPLVIQISDSPVRTIRVRITTSQTM